MVSGARGARDADLPSWDELFGSGSVLAKVQAAVIEDVDFLAVGADPDPVESALAEPPSLNGRLVTLTWAELLPNRKEQSLRLAVMRAMAKLRAHGIPILRWHLDRAKEHVSRRLFEWMASQGIMESKSAPEDHAANGRAEVAVREVKRSVRKCLLAASLPSKMWPLAIRQATKQSWRRVMTMLGAPSRMLLLCGTWVHGRNREWKRRDDKAWGPRTIKGRLVGPASQTVSAYVVMLEDKTLYISSSVHPLPTDITPKPKFRHGQKQPLGSIRALSSLGQGESLYAFRDVDGGEVSKV